MFKRIKKKERKRARAQRAATREYQAAVLDHAETMHETQGQQLANAEIEARRQHDQAMEQGDLARQRIEDARVDSFRSLYTQERAAAGALAAGGGRGGSAMGTLEREVFRSEQRGREQFSDAHRQVGWQLDDASAAYTNFLTDAALKREQMDSGLEKARAGVAYSVTMADINYDRIKQQTEFSWLTGSLQIATTGMGIYGTGAGLGWWGGGA